MNEPIKEFKDEYYCFSNFYIRSIFILGAIYPSNEHAYHAFKTLDQNEREDIRTTKEPIDAKRKGRLVKLRDDWYNIDRDVMMYVNLTKYMAHHDLRRRLVATDGRELIEGNWWKDTYWGVCNGIGENHHGKGLMKIRGLWQ